ncbi:MAG: hypothetical protein H6812_02835 [Phycisphaeraceae bacterium]|nr:hypothetical protein [Phycisphaerales bacterium]MCA9306942.1 hypothetical protein [Phycisphaerales bacterium]MCB9842175.1 hypothetical protein [Phycisphaeraceae bacterium]
MGLIWDLWQQKQIGDVEAAVDTAGMSASRAVREVGHMEQRLERLALACQAMWELLSEHTGITEEQLMARMEDIDFRDGSLDGKMKSGVMTCPTCKRRVNAKHSICMYCTHPIQKPHVFE